MTNNILNKAETFIWENARLLERRRFAFHFKGGSADAIIDALRPYQNDDGGFGNALEPDIRCPDSQPVPTQHALEFLDEVGFDTAIVKSVCDYLQTITTDEGGVPWLLPSALHYPRAPWWQIGENPPASLNPTGAIVGLLHKNEVQHEWLPYATQFCWSSIEKMQASEMHEVGVGIIFLRYVPDRQRSQLQLNRIVESMRREGLISGNEADGYVRKALDWAPTPAHPMRPYFSKDEIEANLQTLVEQQHDDGGWDISWPPLSQGCRTEWRGWVTLNNLLLLRANGWLL